MRAIIDAILCSGHGRCRALAPQIYRLDDNGYNADRGAVIEISPEAEAEARRGARACPERAITLED